MKKTWLVLAAFSLIGFMMACNNTNDMDDTPQDEPVILPEPTTITFDGTIEEINGQSALVAIDDGPILSSGDLVTIDLSIAPEDTFEIGDQVRVGYDGSVRESYPLQIDTLTVEKLN